MHGERENSRTPRTVWVIIHALLVLTAAWIYFGGGAAAAGRWFGGEWHAGDLGRRVLLMSLGVVLWVRMTLTAFVLLKRKFGWNECLPVIAAVAVYQVGFALLGARALRPLGPLDYAAGGMWLLGSYLNTASELQRRRFKQKKENQGKLFTGGWFRVVRHPNYLGDILWASGWALLTANAWAVLIPLTLAAGFVFGFIPELSGYLEQRYGEQYAEWAKETPRLIPFLY